MLDVGNPDSEKCQHETPCPKTEDAEEVCCASSEGCCSEQECFHPGETLSLSHSEVRPVVSLRGLHLRHLSAQGQEGGGDWDRGWMLRGRGRV